MADKVIANKDLTIVRDGKEPLHFEAGQECKGTPEGWPKQALIDKGVVTVVSKPVRNTTQPDTGEDEENA